MSMKRTKQPGTGDRGNNTVSDYWAKPVPAEKSWEDATAEKTDDDFVAYTMAKRYAVGQLISHPKFGKGVVTDAEPLRVEILFQDGKKKLGHGQA